MAVWGIGSMFGGTEEQKDNFIKQGFVCLGWNENQKTELYECLRKIRIGDIIYLKSLFVRSKNMKIKAIGIVNEEFKNENTHIGYEQCGNQIGVKWINTNVDKSIEVTDQQINERKTSVFLEKNDEYKKLIIEFI